MPQLLLSRNSKDYLSSGFATMWHSVISAIGISTATIKNRKPVMIDTEQIKQNIDCRNLIERDLGKPKYCTHKYSTYKCPPHHEEKGYSFQDGYQN